MRHGRRNDRRATLNSRELRRDVLATAIGNGGGLMTRMRTPTGTLGLALVAVSAVVATQDPAPVTNPPERFNMRVVASGLEGPWELAWGPDQHLWVT